MQKRKVFQGPKSVSFFLSLSLSLSLSSLCCKESNHPRTNQTSSSSAHCTGHEKVHTHIEPFGSNWHTNFRVTTHNKAILSGRCIWRERAGRKKGPQKKKERRAQKSRSDDTGRAVKGGERGREKCWDALVKQVIRTIKLTRQLCCPNLPSSYCPLEGQRQWFTRQQSLVFQCVGMRRPKRKREIRVRFCAQCLSVKCIQGGWCELRLVQCSAVHLVTAGWCLMVDAAGERGVSWYTKWRCVCGYADVWRCGWGDEDACVCVCVCVSVCVWCIARCVCGRVNPSGEEREGG